MCFTIYYELNNFSATNRFSGRWYVCILSKNSFNYLQIAKQSKKLKLLFPGYSGYMFEYSENGFRHLVYVPDTLGISPILLKWV